VTPAFSNPYVRLSALRYLRQLRSGSVTALHLSHIRCDCSCFPVPGTNLTADKLNRLLGSSTGVLAPDLITVVEDGGRQWLYGCDMLCGHSAFLLNLVD